METKGKKMLSHDYPTIAELQRFISPMAKHLITTAVKIEVVDGSDIGTEKLWEQSPQHTGYRAFALKVTDHDDEQFLICFFDLEVDSQCGPFVFAGVQEV